MFGRNEKVLIEISSFPGSPPKKDEPPQRALMCLRRRQHPPGPEWESYPTDIMKMFANVTQEENRTFSPNE